MRRAQASPKASLSASSLLVPDSAAGFLPRCALARAAPLLASSALQHLRSLAWPQNASAPRRYNAEDVQLLSWAPKSYLYKGFMSHEECDHFIKAVRKGAKT